LAVPGVVVRDSSVSSRARQKIGADLDRTSQLNARQGPPPGRVGWQESCRSRWRAGTSMTEYVGAAGCESHRPDTARSPSVSRWVRTARSPLVAAGAGRASW